MGHGCVGVLCADSAVPFRVLLTFSIPFHSVPFRVLLTTVSACSVEHECRNGMVLMFPVSRQLLAWGIGTAANIAKQLCCCSKLKGDVEVIDKILCIMLMVDRCTGTNSGS